MAASKPTPQRSRAEVFFGGSGEGLGGLRRWSGLFPSGPGTFAPRVWRLGAVFGAAAASVAGLAAPSCLSVLYPGADAGFGEKSPGASPQPWPFQCSTAIDFAENQLSPGSVSFSLLPTAPPMLLQQQRVRPDIWGAAPPLRPNGTAAGAGHQCRRRPTFVQPPWGPKQRDPQGFRCGDGHRRWPLAAGPLPKEEASGQGKAKATQSFRPPRIA